MAEEYDTNFYKAKELVQTQKISEAITLLNKAIADKPNCPELYYFRGALLVGKEKYTSAINDQRKVIELSKNNLLLVCAYLCKANAEESMKQFDEANKDYLKALSLEPKMAILHLEYSGFLFRTSVKGDPVFHAHKAKEFKFGDLSDKRVAKVAELLKLADSGYYAKNAVEQLQINDPKAAIEILNEGIAKNPTDAELYSIRGPLLLEKGQLKASMSDHKKVIEFAEKKDHLTIAVAYINKAVVEYKWHQNIAAETSFKKAIEIKPNLYLSHLEYAKFLMLTKRPDLAVSHFRKAKELAEGRSTSEYVAKIDKLLQEALSQAQKIPKAVSVESKE